MSGTRGKMNEQIDWLKSDLKNVDRSKTPWVITFAHRPYYVAIGGKISWLDVAEIRRSM